MPFVRSGCKPGAEDLDLVKYVQLREAWESKQYEKVGSTELLFLNQARKKYTGARYEGLYSAGEKKMPAASFTTYGSHKRVK